MRYTPKSELEQRIARLQEKLRRENVDGAVLVQNADLFYFTGTIQRSHLFVPATGQPVLMVKKSLERAQRESSLAEVIGLDSLKSFKEIIQSYGHSNISTLGFELDILPTNLYHYYQKILAPVEIVDISPLIREVRMIKSPYEIEILKEVAVLQNMLFDVIRERLREGITEVELSGAVSEVARKHGHAGYLRVRGFNQDLYYLHLLSGDNTTPSYFDGSVGGSGVGPSFAQGASSKPILRNEPVLADMSFVHEGYILDQTRIFCLGQLPTHLAEAHAIAIEIIRETEKIGVPGLPCGELYNRAMEIAQIHGLSGHFLGYPDPVAFVGHGIGLELDELPVIGRGFTTPLEKGMVFAFEPKFVFPDGAVGVENTYTVTDSGLENLTVYEEEIIYL